MELLLVLFLIVLFSRRLVRWIESLKGFFLICFTVLPMLIGVFIFAILGANFLSLVFTVFLLTLTLFFLVLLFLNPRNFCLWLIAIGAILNTAVVVANGGMPFDPEKAQQVGLSVSSLEKSHRYIIADETTKLSFLGDIIIIPSLFLEQGAVVSIGDIFIFFAFLLTLAFKHRTSK